MKRVLLKKSFETPEEAEREGLAFAQNGLTTANLIFQKHRSSKSEGPAKIACSQCYTGDPRTCRND
jgi:hypothetical protein